jgi:hypothetical protein
MGMNNSKIPDEIFELMFNFFNQKELFDILKYLPSISHQYRKLYYQFINSSIFWEPIMLKLNCDIRRFKHKDYYGIYVRLFEKRKTLLDFISEISETNIPSLWTDKYLIDNTDIIRKKIGILAKSQYIYMYLILCCRYLDLNIVQYNLNDISDLMRNGMCFSELFNHINFYVNDNEITLKHQDLVYELILRKKLKPKYEYFTMFLCSSMIELLINNGLNPNYDNGILATLISDKHSYYALRKCSVFNMRSRDDYLLYRMVDHPHIFYELIEVYMLDPSKYSNQFIELFTSYSMYKYVSKSKTLKYILECPNVIESLDNTNITKLKEYIFEHDYDNRDTYPLFFNFTECYEKANYNPIFNICVISTFAGCVILIILANIIRYMDL